MDILDLGTPRLTYRRLLALIRYLPRESATAVALVGPPDPWSDAEYLLARIADSTAHLGWMFAGVHAKNAPRRPPEPVPRPNETRHRGMVASVNQRERATYAGGSMTIEELLAAVERQTGSPRGIASGVD